MKKRVDYAVAEKGEGQMTVRCPECSAELKPRAVSCPECGASIPDDVGLFHDRAHRDIGTGRAAKTGRLEVKHQQQNG